MGFTRRQFLGQLGAAVPTAIGAVPLLTRSADAGGAALAQSGGVDHPGIHPSTAISGGE